MSSLRMLKSLALLLTVAQASHVRDSEDENGSQFLAFNGTVSASVTYPAELQDVCDARTLGPYIKSYLYVGLNPSWDTNPFFFELFHRASDSTGTLLGGLTEDKLYNLDFASSAYACWRNSGKPCSWYETQWHYRPEMLLDLTKASVKKVSNINGEAGYEITGDEKSYVKNETERATVNGVDVADGCYSPGRFDWTGLVWNDTISWTYSVSFSNKTATASIKTSIGDNVVEITYSGERLTSSTDEIIPQIELVVEDETKPGFRYSNDSQIHFRNTTDGWQASPNEFEETSTSSRMTRTSTTTATSTSTGDATTTTAQPSNTGAAHQIGSPNTLWGSIMALGGIYAMLI